MTAKRTGDASAQAAVKDLVESAHHYSAEFLSLRAIERRAIEAVVWGMPIVNFDLMQQAAKRLGADTNQIVFWSRLSDWKNQTLTPNPDAVYLMPFFNTKSGPMVLEIPPADGGTIVGSVMDCWQAAIEDVGPAGVDKGKGGKYLILPPAYSGKVPDGYIAMPSTTHDGYALLRSIPLTGTDSDVAKAVAYAKNVKLYPLASARNPLATKFTDASDAIFDATIPYDFRFFESLDRMVQAEPWLTRDKAMIDVLKTIGIEKGKPFQPDAAMHDVLVGAVGEAHAWQQMEYERVFETPYYEGTYWALPASQEFLNATTNGFSEPDSYPVDSRGLTYSLAFFSARHLGAGQFYLMTIKDRAGEALDGGEIYRLRVPAKAPVKQYWSATVYDRATHGLIRDMNRASRSSQNIDLRSNADGSVDVYLGAKAPSGQEANWVPTKAGGQFEVLFRFYGPNKPVFDKSWRLPDIEKVG